MEVEKTIGMFANPSKKVTHCPTALTDWYPSALSSIVRSHTRLRQPHTSGSSKIKNQLKEGDFSASFSFGSWPLQAFELAHACQHQLMSENAVHSAFDFFNKGNGSRERHLEFTDLMRRPVPRIRGAKLAQG